jgi:hypothetical protein
MLQILYKHYRHLIIMITAQVGHTPKTTTNAISAKHWLLTYYDNPLSINEVWSLLKQKQLSIVKVMIGKTTDSDGLSCILVYIQLLSRKLVVKDSYWDLNSYHGIYETCNSHKVGQYVLNFSKDILYYIFDEELISSTHNELKINTPSGLPFQLIKPSTNIDDDPSLIFKYVSYDNTSKQNITNQLFTASTPNEITDNNI